MQKTGANEEGENEGETHAVTVIPIQPSFPPTQQCHYSANNKPSPYPPPSYPQRPSLNQPQSLSTALSMTNTTFSTNQNTNQEMKKEKLYVQTTKYNHSIHGKDKSIYYISGTA